jgi:hypothetical protein
MVTRSLVSLLECAKWGVSGSFFYDTTRNGAGLAQIVDVQNVLGCGSGYAARGYSYISGIMRRAIVIADYFHRRQMFCCFDRR